MDNRIIEKSVLIDVPASSVWNALTNPEIIKQWLFDTEIEVISDWKPGSPIEFRGKFHGKKFEDRGTILASEPGKLLRYTYLSWISKLPDNPENYTTIEFRFLPEPGQTLLNLTQTGFRAKASFEHWNFYWNVTLGILKRVVEGGRQIATVTTACC
jgi:uncharacterized protein YndB with AHSA1/START domain